MSDLKYIIRKTPTTPHEVESLEKLATEYIRTGQSQIDLMIKQPEVFKNVPDLNQRKQHWIHQIQLGQQIREYIQQPQFQELFDKILTH